MVSVKTRSLSATIRPFTSKIRPRSGVIFTVRVRTSRTRSSSPGASTTCKNHNRTVKSPNNIKDTVAKTDKRDTGVVRAISAPQLCRAMPNYTTTPLEVQVVH